MNSRAARQLAYVKQRLGNAWWMLREGRLRDFAGALGGELTLRVKGTRNTSDRERALAALVSAHGDPCRLHPPSARPTAGGAPVAHPDSAALPGLAAELRSNPKPQQAAAGREG